MLTRSLARAPDQRRRRAVLTLILRRRRRRDEDVKRYKDGSAKIALALKEPFDRYLLIEKAKGKCDELQSTIDNEFASLKDKCSIRQGDSNTALCAWCGERDWRRERAVVFLDPFGLTVEWTTVQSLGATKAVDLWYLFPINLLRMLKKDGVIEPVGSNVSTGYLALPIGNLESTGRSCQMAYSEASRKLNAMQQFGMSKVSLKKGSPAASQKWRRAKY